MRLLLWKNGYDPYDIRNTNNLLGLHYIVVNNFEIKSFDEDKISGLTYTLQLSRIISISNITRTLLGDIWYNMFYNVDSIFKLPKYQKIRCIVYNDDNTIFFDGMLIRETVKYDPYSTVVSFSALDMLGVFFNWILTVDFKVNDNGAITLIGQSTLYDSNACIGPLNYLLYLYFPQAYSDQVNLLMPQDNSFKLSLLTKLFRTFNNISQVWQNKVYNDLPNYWDTDGNITTTISLPNQYRRISLYNLYNYFKSGNDTYPILKLYNKVHNLTNNITIFIVLSFIRISVNNPTGGYDLTSYICIPTKIFVNALNGTCWLLFFLMSNELFNWGLFERTSIEIRTDLIGSNTLEGYTYIPTTELVLNSGTLNYTNLAYQALSFAMKNTGWRLYRLPTTTWLYYLNSFSKTDTHTIQTLVGLKINTVALLVIDLLLNSDVDLQQTYLRLVSKKNIYVNGHLQLNNIFLKRTLSNFKQLLKLLLLFSNHYIKYNNCNSFQINDKNIDLNQYIQIELSYNTRYDVSGISLKNDVDIQLFTVYNPQIENTLINEDADVRLSLKAFYDIILNLNYNVMILLHCPKYFQLYLGQTVLINNIKYKIFGIDQSSGLYKLTLYGNGYNIQ